jgi:DNA-binding transcriptional ArsR family regulator
MDTILASYELETVEQLRAIADELRMRLVDQLALQAMTVTQLAELLGEAPNKLHYHVRELERVGLVKKVETREKGAILEKYYRAVAQNILLPQRLWHGMAPDEAATMLNDVLQPFVQAFIRASEQALQGLVEKRSHHVAFFTPGAYWMSKKEFEQVSGQILELLKPYEQQRGIEQEEEQTILVMAYTTAQAEVQETPLSSPETPASGSSSPPLKRKLVVQIGMGHYTRRDLEAFLTQGEAKNMYVLGACVFDEDIPPELVERTIAGFHIKGTVHASPEVRAVLKRKGGETGKKSP